MTADPCGPEATAADIAAAVAARKISAAESVDAALTRIDVRDRTYNAFTTVLAARARARAQSIDAALARGDTPGPLAGVPFAVKNLFDIAGVPTLAGSKINADLAPARHDATLIARLEAAGAILVGALGMGEYAYDFTGRNAHYGHVRNPHDTTRMSGGSSSGSGAAVAGREVPLALGSDTNGSIRVPSSLCGVFGLKPTFGRLSRHGTFPFVASLDHLGPFARSARDLALSYDAMQGPDPADPACAQRPVDPVTQGIDAGISGLRIAVADGYFAQGCSAETRAALATAAQALGATARVTVPEAQRARAAAFVITASEGGALHLERLRSRAADFDPETRDRLIAGALIPAAWVNRAQRFRQWYRGRVAELFETVDIILAPATPVTAPRIDQMTMQVDGVEIPVRASLGMFTQPISFVGLPVVAAPIAGGDLPVAIQIIARPWAEGTALRVAAALEKMRVAVAAPLKQQEFT